VIPDRPVTLDQPDKMEQLVRKESVELRVMEVSKEFYSNNSARGDNSVEITAWLGIVL
jgi:hypothetical protein